MDPFSATLLAAVLKRMLEGAEGEAGAKTLEALGRLLRRAAKKQPPASAELERAVNSPAPRDASALAAYLSEVAAADEALQRDLAVWLAEARTALGEDSVSNAISGHVTGNVVQARDIGSVQLG
jgi:hypothetical protein